MNLSDETALVEAIVFLENEPVELKTLVGVSGLSREVVLRALAEIKDRFDQSEHGLELVHIGDGYQFQPKQYLWDALKSRYGKRNDSRLSRAAMETLSIIAYSQPITRVEIENLRGVAADGMIKLLVSRNLIREVGKKDAPGRPVQYGTTKEFLKLFRLSSISDLPKLDETEEDRFRLNG